MRWNTLSRVRDKLKSEIGYAIVANAIQDAELNALIENKQEWLAGEYNWPFLLHRWDIAVGAGVRYVNFATSTAEASDTLSADTEADEGPTQDLNTDLEVKAEVYYNLKWEEVKYGIGSEELNIWDPALGQNNDPIQRFQYYDQGQLEVWPVPASAQKLRLTGYRYPTTLRKSDNTFDDSAKLDLDDLLVVYYCAAEKLVRSGQADAQIKLQLAVERLRKVRASLPSRDRKVIYGDDKAEREQLRKVVPIIGVHG